MRLARISSLLLLITGPSWAHELVGEGASVETIALVTMPTAGILSPGSLLLRAALSPDGTLTAQCFASPIPRLMLGLSFSGRNVLGIGSPEWQPFPGISVRLRFVDERTVAPALAVGLHTQGWGSYKLEEKRFTVPAPGIFVAASKSYRWWLGELAWHAMVSYPLEPPPPARHPTWGFGFEHSLGRFGQLLLEYNALWGDIRNRRSIGAFSIGLLFGLGHRGAVGGEMVDIFPPSGSAHPWARALTAAWYLR